MRVLAILWNDGGDPNCDLYAGPESIEAAMEITDRDMDAILDAISSPGEIFELPDHADQSVRYCEVYCPD